MRKGGNSFPGRRQKAKLPLAAITQRSHLLPNWHCHLLRLSFPLMWFCQHNGYLCILFNASHTRLGLNGRGREVRNHSFWLRRREKLSAVYVTIIRSESGFLHACWFSPPFPKPSAKFSWQTATDFLHQKSNIGKVYLVDIRHVKTVESNQT